MPPTTQKQRVMPEKDSFIKTAAKAVTGLLKPKSVITPKKIEDKTKQNPNLRNPNRAKYIEES